MEMRVTPSRCPYCGKLKDSVRIAEGVTPKDGDISLCVSCGEFVMFGPYLTLRKCELTPEQMADKLGLVAYGAYLLIQENLKLMNEKQKKP